MPEKKRYIMFTIRGERYVVNEHGQMTQAERFEKDKSDFSGEWKLRGVSFHHWRMSMDVGFDRIWEDPTKMNGGLLWDYDHGSTRLWCGSYCGKLPRVSWAHSFDA
jgi:hypothetical protein